MSVLLAACGTQSDQGSPSAAPETQSPPSATASAPSETPSSPSATASTARAYELSSCPVPDEAFCGTALDVIDSLQAGAVDRLFALSREDRLVCAELATEYFPACETEDVLEGYGLSGPQFLVEVVDARGYRRQLDAIVSSIDGAFSDELGDGDVQVIGVGTCGPDIPGRRTYHLAWTAAVSERGAPAERLLGSFELTFEDDWRIALWYLGPVSEWESEQPDPFELAFCEAGRSPWPTSPGTSSEES